MDMIKQMERFARNDTAIISLGQGIPADGMDEALQQVARDVVTSGISNAYSDPQGVIELREAIAESTARDEGLHYTADEVLVTAGAIEAINLALRSVITPERRKVIIVTPTYSAYFGIVQQLGGEVVQLPLVESANWSLPIDRLKYEMGSDVAAVLVCNPGNPTGVVMPQAELDTIVEQAKEHGAVVVLDEVYRHFVFGETTFYSPAENLEYKDAIIRVMSFSKDFNMTGWRIGYLQAARERMAQLVARHDSLVNCAPVISQYVALAAVAESPRIFAANRSAYEERRAQMSAVLDTLGDRLSYQMPQAGYFLFPRITDAQNSAAVVGELVKRGVVVVPGEAFGEGGQAHIRLCFGRSGENIAAGMQRVAQYFNEN